jgi:hypothetical protein
LIKILRIAAKQLWYRQSEKCRRKAYRRPNYSPNFGFFELTKTVDHILLSQHRQTSAKKEILLQANKFSACNRSDLEPHNILKISSG